MQIDPIAALSLCVPSDLPMLGSVIIRIFKENYNKKKRERVPATELGW